jgi:predicted metalloprotease with PDZ domain
VRHDGVELSDVVPGGPSDHAGLKPGDVILAIGDRFLFTVNELNDEIRHYKAGSSVAPRYKLYSTMRRQSHDFLPPLVARRSLACALSCSLSEQCKGC